MSGETTIPGALLASGPAAIEAERALLGLLVENNEAFQRVGGFLNSAHFADPAHGIVYDCIASLIEAGQRADIPAVKAELERLEREGILEDVDGVDDYLASLRDAMGCSDQAADYGRAIQRSFLLRETIEAGKRLMHIGLSNPDDLEQEWRLAMQDIAELNDSMKGLMGIKGEAAAAAVQHTVPGLDVESALSRLQGQIESLGRSCAHLLAERRIDRQRAFNFREATSGGGAPFLSDGEDGAQRKQAHRQNEDFAPHFEDEAVESGSAASH